MKFKTQLTVELEIPKELSKSINEASLDVKYHLIRQHFEDIEKTIRNIFQDGISNQIVIKGITELKK